MKIVRWNVGPRVIFKPGQLIHCARPVAPVKDPK